MDHDAKPGRAAALLLPAVACLALAALASCSGNSTYAPPMAPYTYTPSPLPTTPPGGALSAADLNGRTYTSTAVDGRTLLPRTAIKAGFHSDVMAVSGGCNVMTGPFEVAGRILRWTQPPITTSQGCSAAQSRQDQWVRTTFTSGLKVTGDPATALNLRNATVTIHLSPNSG